jgi:hypothetical protein
MCALYQGGRQADGLFFQTLQYRRYNSGKPIHQTKLHDTLGFVAADLHKLLRDFTTATLKLNTEIVSYHDSPEELDGPLPHGRPYALSATGEKFYVDCIIACDGDAGLARRHVLQSLEAQETAKIDTRWNEMAGSVLSDSLDGAAATLVQGGDRADVWVGQDAYVSTLVVGGGEELVFRTYDLDADDEGELDIEDLVEGWDAAVAEALTIAAKAEAVGVRRLKIRQKPGSLVSRKSRKMLLFGKNGFTFPPHSPHLVESYHVEAAATLAVCLRKAASVPLGLEVYTRMMKPRCGEAMRMAQERFDTITASAAAGELEAAELAWDTEVGGEPTGLDAQKTNTWWDYEAEKFAEKSFDGVIEALTAELLGKQREMAAAQANAVQEEAANKKKREGKAGEGDVEHGKAGNGETESRRSGHAEEDRKGGEGVAGSLEKEKAELQAGQDNEEQEEEEEEEEEEEQEQEEEEHEEEEAEEDDEDEDGGVPLEEIVCSKPREKDNQDHRHDNANEGEGMKGG